MSKVGAPSQPVGKHLRMAGLVLFCLVLSGFGLIKAYYDGRFELRSPLPLEGKPTLVFFMLRRGCECQMSVVRAAEAQMAAWDAPDRAGIGVLRVDFSRRPDLAEQYSVERAPALVLLDEQGQVIWKQDLGLNDLAPLDLVEAEDRIRELGAHIP